MYKIELLWAVLDQQESQCRGVSIASASWKQHLSKFPCKSTQNIQRRHLGNYQSRVTTSEYGCTPGKYTKLNTSISFGMKFTLSGKDYPKKIVHGRG